MNSGLKILTWNCNGAFRKKFASICELDADIYIIQECENPEVSSDDRYKEWARNFLWTGENKNKGLGIFAKPNIIIRDLQWDTNGLKYFIACKVSDKFTLLATWCHGANSPTFGYIGQLWKYLQIHKSNLGRTIIAGDFNSNVIWDKWDRWWNHSNVVKELEEMEIQSLYHKFYKEEQGSETKPTFYLQKNRAKSYHIDYIFGSIALTSNIKDMIVGSVDQWLTLSDHMPVAVYTDFEI
jgi:exonuclease III